VLARRGVAPLWLTPYTFFTFLACILTPYLRLTSYSQVVKLAVQLSAPTFAPEVLHAELEVNVIYTRLPGTANTLRAACTLARGLGARLTVHLAQVIPYPLELKSPQVSIPFAQEQLGLVAGSQPVETRVQVHLCRDLADAIHRVLKPQSLVVMAASRNWWPTREEKLAKRLRRDGHHVILTYEG
jgi:hypothetical protein